MKNRIILTMSLILTTVLYFLLFKRAISGIDMSWDSLSYHLPFAEKFWDIIPGSLTLRDDFENRFLGFPLLPEMLQGLLWKIFGSPKFANVVSLFSLLFLQMFMAVKLKIKFSYLTVFLFSIPLIVIHATSSYVDLIANVFISIPIILLFERVAEKRELTIKKSVLIALTLCLTVACKYNLLPISVLLFIIFIFFLIKDKPFSPFLTVIFILVFGILFNTVPIKNFIIHENPLYPLNIKIANIEFQGSKYEYNNERDSKGKGKQFVSFLTSFFEYDLYTDQRSGYFSIDQSSGVRDMPSFKKGGFFVANVMLWFIMALVLVFTRTERSCKLYLLCFLFLFTITGLFHASHFLRYWMYLTIVLLYVCIRIIQISKIDQATLIFFCSLQVMIFLVVLRFIYPYYKTREEVRLRGYRLKDSSQSVCIVDQERSVIFYMLANPGKSFTHVKYISECGDAIVPMDKNKNL